MSVNLDGENIKIGVLKKIKNICFSYFFLSIRRPKNKKKKRIFENICPHSALNSKRKARGLDKFKVIYPGGKLME